MATAVAVPLAAPKTGDIVASFTDQLPTTTIKTEFRDAGELLAEFESIDSSLESEALPLKQAIEQALPTLDKVFLLLVKMQALLSQRGDGRLHRDAGLPTWTEYYEAFSKKVGLPSIRTFQRKLAAAGLSLHGDDKRTTSPGHPFRTGIGPATLLRMLTELLDQIERLNKLDREKAWSAVMRTVADYREQLNAPPPPPPPPPAPSSVFNLTLEQVRRLGGPRRRKIKLGGRKPFNTGGAIG